MCRRIEHTLLYVIGFLHGLEPLCKPTGLLAGAAQRQQEQKNREGNGAVAQRCARPC